MYPLFPYTYRNYYPYSRYYYEPLPINKSFSRSVNTMNTSNRNISSYEKNSNLDKKLETSNNFNNLNGSNDLNRNCRKNSSKYNNHKYNNQEYDKPQYNSKPRFNNFAINLNSLFNSDFNSPIIEILGFKLYLDDLIILGLLFFLYSENVHDEILFGILLLLLIS